MPFINREYLSEKSSRRKDEIRLRNSDSKISYDHRWTEIRNWYICRHPLCEDCLFEGRSVPAEEVHHIVPWERGRDDNEKKELLYDVDNLVSLCKECHHKRHNGYK